MKGEKTLIQIVKFGVTGVANTLVCMGTIVILHNWLNVHLYVSNFIGYVLGVVNSFCLSKKWVFDESGRKWQKEALLFLVGFAICYLIQFFVMRGLVKMDFFEEMEIHIGAFSAVAPKCGETVAQFISMFAYSACFYVYNRFVSFKPKHLGQE